MSNTFRHLSSSITRAALLCLLLAAAAFALFGLLQRQAMAQEEAATQESATLSANGFCGWLCQLKERQAQQLEGSWAVTVTIARPGAPPPFRVYFTFARGGGQIGTDMRRPFSQAHGAWTHLGGNEFAFTNVEELFDAMGNFAGTFKGRAKVTITGANTFVGVSNAEQRNAAGEIVVSGCSTMRTERITVEPLAPQYQSITPPQ
jgi:hypothetical protein